MALHFFSTLADALKRRLDEATRAPAVEMDPIDHPAIAAMSPAELADLPLGPDCYVRPAARRSVDQPTAAARAETLAPT